MTPTMDDTDEKPSISQRMALLEQRIDARDACAACELTDEEVKAIRHAIPAGRIAKWILSLVAGAAVLALGSGVVALKASGAKDGRVDTELETLRHDADRLSDQLQSLWTMVVRREGAGLSVPIGSTKGSTQ
jgi:hypothetical protein